MGGGDGGCVAAGTAQMTWLLTWLRSGTAPVVSVSVEERPYAVTPNRYV